MLSVGMVAAKSGEAIGVVWGGFTGLVVCVCVWAPARRGGGGGGRRGGGNLRDISRRRLEHRLAHHRRAPAEARTWPNQRRDQLTHHLKSTPTWPQRLSLEMLRGSCTIPVQRALTGCTATRAKAAVLVASTSPLCQRPLSPSHQRCGHLDPLPLKSCAAASCMSR